ncbi:MAG: hypothetical protein JNJ61_12645 [Anaerolineae bacterium]|nr:hypothetical protein [Anaerolineae bacterium]
MSELYDRIVSERGSFERLVARLPGFKGYVDNKARRSADRLLRDHIADQLSQRVARLVRIEKVLLDNGGLSFMTKTQSAKTKLQLYRDRVAAAVPGYSGFFAAIKIGAEEMEKLYSFDEAQVRYLDQFDTALTGLESAVNAKDGIAEAISALDQVTVEANDAFSLREDVLTGLDKSLS